MVRCTLESVRSDLPIIKVRARHCRALRAWPDLACRHLFRARGPDVPDDGVRLRGLGLSRPLRRHGPAVERTVSRSDTQAGESEAAAAGRGTPGFGGLDGSLTARSSVQNRKSSNRCCTTPPRGLPETAANECGWPALRKQFFKRNRSVLRHDDANWHSTSQAAGETDAQTG